ncbi:MAG: hypothetical protein M1833_006060 [Piccolia ochrophora]|nr:MAG: hypothetical protein M1833_006060 [Piccolia ochrophora]
MRFAGAKSVDVFFDIVVARLGQLLSAAFGWYVLRAALQGAMENMPTTYRLFASFHFDGISVTLLWDLLRDFGKHRSTRGYVVLTWTIVSTLWVLFYSSLASAMSGYTAVGYDWALMPNSTLLSYNDCDSVCLLYVEDGARIGLKDKTLYGFREPEENWATGASLSFYAAEYYRPKDPFSHGSCGGEPLATVPNTSSIFSRYEANSDNSFSPLTTSQIELDAPVLNISGYGYRCAGELFRADLFDPEKTTCKTELDYAWGFSVILLLVFLIGNLIWTLGMYLTWLHVRVNSSIYQAGRTMGKYRAALDLAEAVNEDLGPNLDAYSNDDLDRALRARNGKIKYYATTAPEHSKEVARMGLSSSTSARVALEADVLYGRKVAEDETLDHTSKSTTESGLPNLDPSMAELVPELILGEGQFEVVTSGGGSDEAISSEGGQRDGRQRVKCYSRILQNEPTADQPDERWN